MNQNYFTKVFTHLKGAVLAAGLLTGAMVASPAAEAAPIGNASFGVGGAFNLPSGSHLGNTDSIFIANGGMIIVTDGDTMDLAGIVNVGMTGTLQDLPSISGFTPINGFINLGGGITVDLSSLTLVGQTGPTPGFINLYGNAIINAPGFDPTAGVITLTGNSSDNTSFTLAITTSATSNPTEGVPEPMSLALLGLGLMALFAMSRRRTAVTMNAAAA